MHRWLRWLIAALAVAAAGTCAAQPVPAAYPSRPVRIIVPFGTGGPGDVFARLVAQQLGENLGRNFLVENHPGAGGTIGTAVAARAPPTATRWW